MNSPAGTTDTVTIRPATRTDRDFILGLVERFSAFPLPAGRDHACTRLTLSVFPGNTRARRLYEAGGFTDDLLRMARPLD